MGIDTNVVNKTAIYSFQTLVASTNSMVQGGTTVTITVPNQLKVQTTSGSQMPTCYTTLNQAPNIKTNVTITNCLYQSVGTPSTNTISFTIPADATDLVSYTIYVGPILNPPSCTTGVASFQIAYSGGYPTGGQTSGLKKSYIPGPMTGTLSQSSNGFAKAGAADDYQIQLQWTNWIPQGGYLQITFPSDKWPVAPITSAGVQTQIQIFIQGQAITGFQLGAPVTNNVVLLKDVFSLSSYYPITNKYLVIKFPSILNFNQIATSNSFTITTMDGNQYAIDQITTGLKVTVNLAGAIDIISFSTSTTTVATPCFLLFDLEPTVLYSPGGWIEIDAPDGYITMQDAGAQVCNAQFGFDDLKPQRFCDVAGTTVLIGQDLDQNENTQLFVVYYYVNPLGVVTIPSFKVSYVNPDNSIVAQVTTGLSYTTTPGTCTVQQSVRDPTFLQVGINTARYLFQFKCDHQISSVGTVTFIMPGEQMGFTTGDTIKCLNYQSANSTITGTCSATQNSTGYVTVQVSQWCSPAAGCAEKAQIAVVLSGVTNPSYIVPNVASSVEIWTYNTILGQVLNVDQLRTGIKMTNQLIPGPITVTSITRLSLGTTFALTGGTPTYRFQFTTTTKIPQNGIIKIYFPPQTIYVASTAISCTSDTGTATACNVATYTTDATQIYSVQWTGACTAAAGCPAGSTFILRITGVKNYYSTAPNTNIQYMIQTMTSQTYLIDQGNGTLAYAPLSPNIMAASLTAPVTPIIVGAIQSYTITISSTYNILPSTATGGSLVLTFPTEVQLLTASCAAQTTSITLTCTANIAAQTLKITSPSVIPTGTQINIQMLNNVNNPPTGRQSSAFSISTFQGTFQIDTNIALTVNCDTPNLIQNVVSKRSTFFVNIATDLTICFYTTNPIEANANVIISIPSDQEVTSSATVRTNATGTLASTNVATSGSYKKFTVKTWCDTFCKATDQQCLFIKDFNNPSSSQVASTSIIIEVNTFDGEIIDKISTGVFTIPYVSLGPLESMDFDRDIQVVGEQTIFTIDFKTDSTNGALASTTALAYISLPVDFFFLTVASSAVTYTVAQGGGGAASTTATLTTAASPSNMGTYVTSIKVILKCTSTTCGAGQTFTLVIKGLTNPFKCKYLQGGIISIATQSQSGSVWSTINSLDYQLWKAPLGTNQFQFPDYLPNEITAYSAVRTNYTVDQPTVITFQMTLPTRLAVKGYIQVTLPTEQLVLNSVGLTYQQFKTAYGTSQTLQTVSSSATSAVVQMTEWCSALNNNFYCIDNYVLKFKVMTGFSNLRSVHTPITMITVQTFTSDNYLVDQISTTLSTLQVTPATVAAITQFTSMSLSSNYVAASGVTYSVIASFGATIKTGDILVLTFSDDFVYNLNSNTVTAKESNSAVTFSTPAATYSIVTSSLPAIGSAQMKIQSTLCASSCSSTYSFNLQLLNCINLLDSSPYKGTLIIAATTSAGEVIATNTIDLTKTSIIPTLIPNILLTPTVTRASTKQGANSIFTMKFTTPGYLLGGSTIEVYSPFDSILLQASETKFTVQYPSGSSNTALTLSSFVSDTTKEQYVTILDYWGCAAGAVCANPITVTLLVSGVRNPYITTTVFDDFVIDFKSPNSALIFKTPVGLKALPPLAYGTITGLNITESTYYVNQKPTYSFQFTTEGNIPAGGKIKITLPQSRAFQDTLTAMSCSFSGSTIAPTTTAAWTTPTTTPILIITLTSVCPTTDCAQGTYTVKCSGNLKNPPSVGKITQNFTISTLSSLNYIVDSGTIYNSLVNPILPQLIPVTVTRQSTLLNAQSIYSVEFTIQNTLASPYWVRIAIALDQVRIPTETPTCLTQTFQPLTCIFIDNAKGYLWIDLKYNQCGTTCASGTVVTIMLSGTFNPSFLTANLATNSWKVYTMNSNLEYIDGADTDILATPALTGQNVYVIAAQLAKNTVYTVTYLKLKIQVGSFLQNNAIMQIDLPDGLFIDAGSNQCIAAAYQTFSFYCTFTTNKTTGYLNQVMLTQPCPFTCDATTSYVFSIPVRTRGDVKPVVGKYLVTTKYTYADVGQGQLANYLTLSPASIVDYYINNEGCEEVDKQCSMYFSFRQVSPIPTNANLGRIRIYLPSELSVVSSSCNMNIGGSIYNSKCTVGTSSRLVVATHEYASGSTMQNQNMTIFFSTIRNPSSTAPTSSFLIYTEKGYTTTTAGVSSTTYYLIDQNVTGIFYQISKPTPFANVNVYRDPMSNNNGYLTGQPTQLTFELNLKHTLAKTAQFQFQLPAAAQVMFSPTITGYTCYSVDKTYAQQNVLLCTYQPSNQTVIVQNLCYVQECTKSQTVRFKVYDDFIQNYYYVVTPFNQTGDSLAIYSTTYDGSYFVDGTTTGVFVKPDLQPNYLIMASPEVIRTDNVVQNAAQWVINFKINMNPVPPDGYITIAVPQGVLFLQSNKTLSISDLDSDTPYKNVTYSQYSDKSVNLITIGYFCNQTNYSPNVITTDNTTNNSFNCTIGSSYSIQMSGIQNPSSQINNENSIVIQTYTPKGYIIERGTTPSINKLFSQLIPLTLTRVEILPMDPIPNVITRYQIIITNDGKKFDETDTVVIVLPSEVALLNSSVTYSRMRDLAATATQSSDLINTRCKSIFEPWRDIKCYVTGYNTLIVKGLLGNPNMHYGLYVNYIQNPSYNCTTSPLKVTVQNSKNQSIATRTTQTTITIYPVIDEDATCNKYCKTCAGSNSTCTSCTVPSFYPIQKDYSCVESCGDGYFFLQNSLKCFKCHDACKTCYDFGNDKCYTCELGFVFQNGACVQSCDAGALLNKTTNQCQSASSSCSNNCKTCSTNTSYCLSCNQNDRSKSVLDPITGKCIANSDSQCNNTISSRFFVNQTSLKCEFCDELCGTCTEKPSTCTSCTTFFSKNILSDLYQTCVDTCGLGTFYNKSDNVCSWCNPVCYLCDGHGADQCLACNKTPEGTQLYKYEDQCVLSCPKDWQVNTDILACVAMSIDYITFPYIFIVASLAFVCLTTVLSTFVSKFKNRFIDIIYALLSLVEAVNRCCLLGNLWVKSSVFLIAINFMNMIATSSIGVFFNFLFMTPIKAHSPHFRTLYKQHESAHQAVTFFSYLSGVNFMRLLSSKFFGIAGLSSDLNDYKFYFQPVNTMSNFTIIFSLSQAAVCTYLLLTNTKYEDIFPFAAFGCFNNLVFVAIQIVKTFLVRAQIVRQARLAQSQPQAAGGQSNNQR